MVADRADDSASRTGWPASEGGHARGGQWHSLPQPNRLLVATVAARLSTVGNDALLLPPLPARRHVAIDSRQTPRESTSQGREEAHTQRRGDRQPVDQDRRTPKRGTHGYDAGKKITGRKRHIVVDTLGLILSVVVHAADVQDRDGGEDVLTQMVGLFSRLKLIWADGGYAGEFVRIAKQRFKRVIEIVKRSDANTFVVLPKRWIVERTFGWFSKYRRLSKDYETLTNSSESMIYIAMINLMIHRLKPG